MPRGIYVRTEAAKAANAAGQRRRFTNPDERARHSARIKKWAADPMNKNVLSKANREVWARPGHREKMSQAHRGQTHQRHTTESRARISASVRKQWARGNLPGRRRAGTRPEQVMAALLEWAGVRFEAQRQFGRYVVDFYLPDSRAVIEVDGEYWHKRNEQRNQGYQARRDQFLLDTGVVSIHHVTDGQLVSAGWMS